MTHLLFHGDNQVASLQALHQAIKSEKGRGVSEIIRLDAKTLTETDLRQALESHSLFGKDKLVIINGWPKAPPLDILSAHSDQPPVFIWHNKTLTAAQLGRLPRFKPQLFKIPVVIFSFLDSLKPQNTKVIVTGFHQAFTAEPVEQVFYMLHRRISQLIQVKDAPQSLKTTDWQKSRLISQSQNFTLDQLLKLHSHLLDIDVESKTGISITPLATTLELLLLNL